MEWHEGAWVFNESFSKYHVTFADGSVDYIGEEDIDMIEVVVLNDDIV